MKTPLSYTDHNIIHIILFYHASKNNSFISSIYICRSVDNHDKSVLL